MNAWWGSPPLDPPTWGLALVRAVALVIADSHRQFDGDGLNFAVQSFLASFLPGGFTLRWSGASSLMVVYLAFFFGLTLGGFYQPDARPNFVPFRMIQYDWLRGGQEFVINILGNLAAGFPMGVLLPSLPGRRCSWVKVAGAGFAVSLLIETLQGISGRTLRGCGRRDPEHLGRSDGIWMLAGGRSGEGPLFEEPSGGVAGRPRLPTCPGPRRMGGVRREGGRAPFGEIRDTGRGRP